TARQRQLLREGRFDYLQGQILPSETGWQYMLEAATYYTPPQHPDDHVLLDGLGHGSQEVQDLTYWDFANRLDRGVTYLQETGEWWHPHPWANLFLPGTATDDFLEHILTDLTPADLGAPGLLLVYPIHTQPLTTPLLSTPRTEVIFLIAALRYTPPDDPLSLERLIATNRDWYDKAKALGGTAYPIGTIPFTQHDWQTHHATSLTGTRRRYDPRSILGRSLVCG
ncbi:hypothetical protein FNH05_17370, partial [Amycolatopsis rhizosphaerae]